MLVHGMVITLDLQCLYALSRGTCLHVLGEEDGRAVLSQPSRVESERPRPRNPAKWR